MLGDFFKHLFGSGPQKAAIPEPSNIKIDWGIAEYQSIEREGKSYDIRVRIGNFEKAVHNHVVGLGKYYEQRNMPSNPETLREELITKMENSFRRFVTDLDPPRIEAAIRSMGVGRAQASLIGFCDFPVLDRAVISWVAEFSLEAILTIDIFYINDYRKPRMKTIGPYGWSYSFRKQILREDAIVMLAATPDGHMAASVDNQQLLRVGSPHELTTNKPRWNLKLKDWPLAIGFDSDARILLVMPQRLLVLDNGKTVNQYQISDDVTAAALSKNGGLLALATTSELRVHSLPDFERRLTAPRSCKELAFQSGALVAVNPEVHVYSLEDFRIIREMRAGSTTRVVGQSIMGMAMDSDIEIDEEAYVEAAWSGEALLAIDKDGAYKCFDEKIGGVSLDTIKTPPGCVPRFDRAFTKLIVDGGSLYSFHNHDVFVIDLAGHREPKLFPKASAVTAIQGGAIFGHDDGRISVQEL